MSECLNEKNMTRIVEKEDIYIDSSRENWKMMQTVGGITKVHNKKSCIFLSKRIILSTCFVPCHKLLHIIN